MRKSDKRRMVTGNAAGPLKVSAKASHSPSERTVRRRRAVVDRELRTAIGTVFGVMADVARELQETLSKGRSELRRLETHARSGRYLIGGRNERL